MEGRDSPGPFSESFCVPVAICGQKALLTLGRRCRTWAREAGSTLAGCGGKAARRTDWPVGVGCMERAQLRTGRPKVAREVAEHSMDSKKRRFRHIYFIRRQRQRDDSHDDSREPRLKFIVNRADRAQRRYRQPVAVSHEHDLTVLRVTVR